MILLGRKSVKNRNPVVKPVRNHVNRVSFHAAVPNTTILKNVNLSFRSHAAKFLKFFFLPTVEASYVRYFRQPTPWLGHVFRYFFLFAVPANTPGVTWCS